MSFRVALALAFIVSAPASLPARSFTLEQILSAPFPSDLTAAPKGGKVALVLNERARCS
jgi:hypothetical protein